MAIYLGWMTAVILCLLSAAHAFWGFGYTWPDKDSRSLARRVAGFKNIQSMPSPAACFAVAVFLMFSALITLLAINSSERFLPVIADQIILIGLAIGFGIRGMFSFVPFWRRMTPEQPFARLDRRYYGPLCLLLSLMLIGIVTQL